MGPKVVRLKQNKPDQWRRLCNINRRVPNWHSTLQRLKNNSLQPEIRQDLLDSCQISNLFWMQKFPKNVWAHYPKFYIGCTHFKLHLYILFQTCSGIPKKPVIGPNGFTSIASHTLTYFADLYCSHVAQKINENHLDNYAWLQ